MTKSPCPSGHVRDKKSKECRPDRRKSKKRKSASPKRKSPCPSGHVRDKKSKECRPDRRKSKKRKSASPKRTSPPIQNTSLSKSTSPCRHEWSLPKSCSTASPKNRHITKRYEKRIIRDIVSNLDFEWPTHIQKTFMNLHGLAQLNDITINNKDVYALIKNYPTLFAYLKETYGFSKNSKNDVLLNLFNWSW